MMNLRKLTVLAITALLVTGISGLSTVTGIPKGETTSTSLLNPVSTLINTVGDDLFSTIDLATLIDPTTSGTQHYGPYANSSGDSGTCGPDWSTDTFDRHFTVFTTGGTFTIVEQFKDGSFLTMAGFSPGSCQDGPPAGTVAGGITGIMHGYFVIPLPPTEIQTSTSPYCDADAMTNTGCTTTIFIDSHFTPCYVGGSGTCPVTTFFFHYAAGDQSLIINEWKNASSDRGGNHGDIRSADI